MEEMVFWEEQNARKEAAKQAEEKAAKHRSVSRTAAREFKP
jgi:hypothetical protein